MLLHCRGPYLAISDNRRPSSSAVHADLVRTAKDETAGGDFSAARRCGAACGAQAATCDIEGPGRGGGPAHARRDTIMPYFHTRCRRDPHGGTKGFPSTGPQVGGPNRSTTNPHPYPAALRPPSAPGTNPPSDRSNRKVTVPPTRAHRRPPTPTRSLGPRRWLLSCAVPSRRPVRRRRGQQARDPRSSAAVLRERRRRG